MDKSTFIRVKGAVTIIIPCSNIFEGNVNMEFNNEELWDY